MEDAMPEETTADLCDALATDLDGAFGRLMTELGPPVYSGLRRLHHDAAEDLLQEAFIRAYRALAGYDADRIRSLSLRGWIWTIALNLGRNHARDRARRPRPVQLIDIHPVTDPDPVDGALWDERLAGISPVQRRAVVLRHVVGLSYADLSIALDRPEGTVKADVSRGLARLRTIIEEEQT